MNKEVLWFQPESFVPSVGIFEIVAGHLVSLQVGGKLRLCPALDRRSSLEARWNEDRWRVLSRGMMDPDLGFVRFTKATFLRTDGVR